MKPTDKLREILNAELKWNKRRIECFVQMLLAIMIVQTINLTKIANQIATKVKLPNRYRRLQRFFEGCRIDYDDVARFIFSLFRFKNKCFYLTLDRTNWKWGKKDINILFLGIVYKGAAIPIYWLVLRTAGNSSTHERKALIQRFIRTFGKDSIQGLLGDREFIGGRWFHWLKEEKIPFYIRIRNDAITQNKGGKEIEVSWLFYHLGNREKLALKKQKNIFGCELFITGGKSLHGELMIIVSNEATDEAIERYLLRWQIEVLFQCLKSRGFEFEETHITHRNKIKKLVVLLAIAFCWAHKTGEWQSEYHKPLKLKKHGRLEKSLFRYGLDLIHDAIAQLVHSVRPILQLIKILSPPNEPEWLAVSQNLGIRRIF